MVTGQFPNLCLKIDHKRRNVLLVLNLQPDRGELNFEISFLQKSDFRIFENDICNEIAYFVWHFVSLIDRCGHLPGQGTRLQVPNWIEETYSQRYVTVPFCKRDSE